MSFFRDSARSFLPAALLLVGAGGMAWAGEATLQVRYAPESPTGLNAPNTAYTIDFVATGFPGGEDGIPTAYDIRMEFPAGSLELVSFENLAAFPHVHVDPPPGSDPADGTFHQFMGASLSGELTVPLSDPFPLFRIVVETGPEVTTQVPVAVMASERPQRDPSPILLLGMGVPTIAGVTVDVDLAEVAEPTPTPTPTPSPTPTPTPIITPTPTASPSPTPLPSPSPTASPTPSPSPSPTPSPSPSPTPTASPTPTETPTPTPADPGGVILY